MTTAPISAPSTNVATTLKVAISFLLLSGPSWPIDARWLPYASALTAAALALTIKRQPRAESHILPISIIAFSGWAVLSWWWSDYPFQTAAASAATVATIAAGTIVGTRAPASDVLRGIALGATTAALSSLALAVALPSVGLVSGRQQDGAVSGIYPHRNILGYVCALGLITFLSMRRHLPSKKLAISSVTILGACLLATQSVTAMSCALVGLALRILLVPIDRLRKDLKLAPLTIAALSVPAAAFAILTFAADFASLVGRDTTLSNRTIIWPLVTHYIEMKPVTGYGWQATWGHPGSIGASVSRVINYDISHSHNGYLDVALQLGAVGLGILIVACFSFILRGLHIQLRDPHPIGTWALIFGGFLAVYNLTETRASQPLGLFLISATLVLTLNYSKTPAIPHSSTPI